MPGDTAQPRRPLLTLWVISSAVVAVPVTATGASVAVTQISGELGTSLAAAQWVVNAFFLTFASFMAAAGSIADRVGRRKVYIGGLILFTSAMLCAAFAPTNDILIAARALAGIGGAAIATAGNSLLAQAFPGASRAKAFGIFGTCIGLGLAVGPLVAGLLVDSVGWRSFFLIAGLCVVPMLCVSPWLSESRSPHRAPIDWLGAAIFTTGLFTFALGLIEGPELGWRHPLVVGALILSVILMAAFWFVENRLAHPLVDVGLLRNSRFLAICAMPILLAFSFVALLIMLPPYFMAVGGVTAAEAGLLLTLLTAPSLLVPPVTGWLARRLSQRSILVVALVLVGLGCAWSTLSPEVTVAQLAGPLLTIGTGFGLTLALIDAAAVSSVDASRTGMAAGLVNTARIGGEVVALAVLGATLAGLTRAGLSRYGEAAATATSQLLQGDIEGAVPSGVDPTEFLAAATASYTQAMHTALWILAALSLLGAMAIWRLLAGTNLAAPARAG